MFSSVRRTSHYEDSLSLYALFISSPFRSVGFCNILHHKQKILLLRGKHNFVLFCPYSKKLQLVCGIRFSGGVSSNPKESGTLLDVIRGFFLLKCRINGRSIAICYNHSCYVGVIFDPSQSFLNFVRVLPSHYWNEIKIEPLAHERIRMKEAIVSAWIKIVHFSRSLVRIQSVAFCCLPSQLRSLCASLPRTTLHFCSDATCSSSQWFTYNTYDVLFPVNRRAPTETLTIGRMTLMNLRSWTCRDYWILICER